MTNLTMIDVIRLGASKRPIPRDCPLCDREAPLVSRDQYRGFVIACETFDCPQSAEGATADEAWAAWEAKAATQPGEHN